jgi:ABC-2 type transport system permease protein
MAFAASVAVPFASAVGFYASAAAVMENPLSFGFFLNNTLVYLPAIWVMLGLGVLLVGWTPRASLVGWGYMVYSIFVQFFGGILGLPDWVSYTTPFGYVPMLIIEDVNYLTMSLLVLIAAVLTTVGFAGYSRRDMAA